MEELLKALEGLYSIPGDTFEDDDAIDEAEYLCEEYLITNGGQCNWDNIMVLREHGYRVFAGDRDSFGWLTGCVQKKGDPRILVYG